MTDNTPHPWPMLSDMHLQAITFAYNEGYSKAYEGRMLPNPFAKSGSQAAAYDLGLSDGAEAREKAEAVNQRQLAANEDDHATPLGHRAMVDAFQQEIGSSFEWGRFAHMMFRRGWVSAVKRVASQAAEERK